MTNTDLNGFPYIEVQIKKSGELNDTGDLQPLKSFIADKQITDLIIVSHGWNNDMAEARSLYEQLFRSIRTVADGPVELPGRTIAVLGIFWPSKKFAESELIPSGGAASFGADQSDDEVGQCLDVFADALKEPSAVDDLEEIRGTIENLDDSQEARELFADKLRSLLPATSADSDDGSSEFFAARAEELFDRLNAPFLPQSPSGGGGAAGGLMDAMGEEESGGAAGLGDFFSGAKAAARRLLNYATYYVMKARAGDVGAKGVKQLVAAVKEQAADTKVHLVGHSFGGRVVTSAAKALGDTAGPKPSSMTLLQAAFSHNGFAENFYNGKDGFFRNVLSGQAVDGPIVVTHTHNDKANAIAYPLASRLAGEDAAGLGGPTDRYGAIGANGAQHTPNANAGTLLAVGATGYDFDAGNLYNLIADPFIKDHGDVAGEQVAYAILSAVATA